MAAAKGLFDSLSVKAQVLIIDLFASTRPSMKDGGMREWNLAPSLNECYGVGAVSRLSKESYSLSRKQVNPKLGELVDVIFSAGDTLTILVTKRYLYRDLRCLRASINVDVFMAVVQRFLDAAVKLSMREFHIRAYDSVPLRWPEAARGLVRPCPRCSNYELGSDEEQYLVDSFSRQPARVAHETFHFHNKTTAQWMTVELRLSDEHIQRENIRKAAFTLVETPPCAFRPILTVLRRCSLAFIILDAVQCLPRSEVEKCQLVGRRWRNLTNTHTRSLPLRRILLYTKPSGEFWMAGDAALDWCQMAPTLGVPFAPSDGLSPSPSELLRNAYVDELKVTDETCKEITAILREVLRDSDLRVGELTAASFSSTSEVVDAALGMSSMWRLAKLEMDPIPYTAFVENYKTIFDASGIGRARHLYLDIYCNDPNLQPPSSVSEDMRNRWLDLVFSHGCEQIVITSGLDFGGLDFPFNADNVINRFLSMKVVGKFTTCVLDAINVKRLPDACLKQIATRQNAGYDFSERLHYRLRYDLYDVYHVRNEHADADLSMLVGAKPWRSRIILMAGIFAGGHPVEDEEDYLDDGEDGDHDQLIPRDKYYQEKENAH